MKPQEKTKSAMSVKSSKIKVNAKSKLSSDSTSDVEHASTSKSETSEQDSGGPTPLTKAEIALLISQQASIPRVKAETILNTVIDTMVEALMEDNRVEIRGFGTFINHYHSKRVGRNPRTGEPIQVTPKRFPYFKMGKELKQALMDV